MAHVLETLQLRCIELEKQLKSKYGSIKFAKQLINGAKDDVNYAFSKEKTEKWWIMYAQELEKRL